MRRLLPLLLAVSAGCATTEMPAPADERVAVDSYTLLAELAWERGELEQAAEHYLAAAQRSPEPALAERATLLAHQLKFTDIGQQAAARWRELAPDSRAIDQFVGIFEARLGHIARAAEHFTSFIDQEGHDPAAAMASIVDLLAAEDDVSASAAVMRRLVETFPDVVEGHYGLARLALRAGDFELALGHARTTTDLDPGWVDGQLLYARALLISGRTAESLGLAAALAEDHPQLEVQLQYAELLLSAGHGEEAEARLNRILDENPGLPEAVRALAFLALTTDQLDAAEERFGQLRTEPRYRDEAFYYLGRIAETRGQLLQATRSYARVIEGTHAVEAQLRTARILSAELGDQAGALRHLQQFGVANPRYSSEMLVAQGQLLLQMERPGDAMRLITDALAENPGDETLHDAHTQLYVILAQDAMSRDDLDEAETLLEEGLEHYPANVSLRYAQALLYQEQGRLRRAVTVLETLVEEQPEDPALLNALGYLLTDSLSRHTEARNYIQKALAMEPDNAAIIDSMGWVLFKLGDYEAALDYLERAYRLESDPEIASHLVDVYWALGDKAQALELLRAALEEHPDSPHLNEVSRRLAQ